MAYTPQLSDRASATLRRLAWAFEMPMTKTIEQVMEDSVNTVDKGKICTLCKDQTKCDLCAFYDKKNIIPEIRLNDFVREPSQKPKNKPDYENIYKGMHLRVCLVREGDIKRNINLSSPADVYNLVKKHLCSSDREVFLSILLTANNMLIGVETVAVGSLDSCIVSPHELFKSAILANAASVILCHNHPSGNTEPSSQDIELTEHLVKAGDILCIQVHDHIIVSHEGYLSLKEESLMKGGILKWAA